MTYRPRNSIKDTETSHREDGVALIMALLIIMGLFLLVLPLALLSRSSEKQNNTLLNNKRAKMYANMALDHTKRRLRLGVYETEYRYDHPFPPTSSPTPTPSDRADRFPYDTWKLDGPAELYFDQQDYNALAAIAPAASDDITSLGIKVEDEQAKLNVNSITPRMLLGLYLVTQDIDPADLSNEELDALYEFFIRVLKPMALARFTPDRITPLSSVDELRNFYEIVGDTYYSLSESEFDAIAEYLTVHSWRQYPGGFSNRYHASLRVTQSMRDSGEAPVQFPRERIYRVDILDENLTVLEREYIYPDITLEGEGDELEMKFTYIISDITEDAQYIAYTAEDFHQVNINNASRELVTAMLMSQEDVFGVLNSKELAFSLAEAWEHAGILKPVITVESVDTEASPPTVQLGGEDYDLLAPVSWFCAGAMYFYGSVSDSTVTLANVDSTYVDLLASYPMPLKASSCFSSLPRTLFAMRTSIETLKDAGSALMSDAVQGEVGPYFTCVNHDIYKITASCNISAPTGLPTGSWTIEEVVKLGTGEELRDIPVAIDRSKDFQPISQNNSNEHRRSYDFRDSPSEFTPVQITFRDEDKTYNEADPPQHFLLPPTAPPLPHSFEPLDADTVYSKSGITGMYLPRNGGKALTSNAQWGGPFDPEADASGLFEVANEDTQVHLVVTHTGQSTDYEEVRVADITNPGSGYPDLGTLSVTLMVKAVEWEPESYSGRKYLFTARAYDEQEQQASETGRSELFIENGNLVLYVEDDNGEWGRLDYDLSGGKFPSDTWMHIRANFCGNKPGQMALFVDGRYCDATYSASAEKGDNYEVHESVPLRKPVMTQAFLTGDATLYVDSTAGFPDTYGYLKVGDEIVRYSSKNAGSFSISDRAVAETEEEDHAVSDDIYPVMKLYSRQVESLFELGDGDEVSIIGMWDLKENSIDYKFRYEKVETFTLDTDPILIDWEPDSALDEKYLLLFPEDYDFDNEGEVLEDPYLLYGVSGTQTMGSPTDGKIRVAFLCPGVGTDEDGFDGFVSHYELATYNDYSGKLGGASLNFNTAPLVDVIKVANELAVSSKRSGGDYEVNRGILGTEEQELVRGMEYMHVPALAAAYLEYALSITDTSIYLPFKLPDYPLWRIDDEAIYVHYIGMFEDPDTNEPRHRYELLRGHLGSSPASHSEGSLLFAIPAFSYSAYDFTSGDYRRERTYAEFVRHRPGNRVLGFTWLTVNDSPYIRTHAWLSPRLGGFFTSFVSDELTYHFTSDDTEFSILRDDSYLVTDTMTVRLAFEYKNGAWSPDDATSHAWKELPMIDRIELWLEDPDIVFSHVEYP